MFIADVITCLQHGSSLGVGVSSGVLLWKQHILGITSRSSVWDGIFMAHVATVEGKCLSQTPLLVYMPLAFRVISVVLWWNEARQLVYMALVVTVTSIQLCFGGCGTARHLWQYVSSVADDAAIVHSLLLNGSFEVSLWCCML